MNRNVEWVEGGDCKDCVFKNDEYHCYNADCVRYKKSPGHGYALVPGHYEEAKEGEKEEGIF